MNDRIKRDCIKLAKAMGWKHEQMRENLWQASWQSPEGEDWVFPNDLPNPFEDANDDFAVLTWMRGDEDAMETPEWRAFKDYFIEVPCDWNIWNYKIGDFARAALKVME